MPSHVSAVAGSGTVSASHTSPTTTATAIAAARPATSPRVRRVISKAGRRVAPRLLFLPAISGEAREPRGFPGEHVTVPLYGAPALPARDAAVDARSSSARPARPPPPGKDSGGRRSVGICRQPREGELSHAFSRCCMGSSRKQVSRMGAGFIRASCT